MLPNTGMSFACLTYETLVVNDWLFIITLKSSFIASWIMFKKSCFTLSSSSSLTSINNLGIRNTLHHRKTLFVVDWPSQLAVCKLATFISHWVSPFKKTLHQLRLRSHPYGSQSRDKNFVYFTTLIFDNNCFHVLKVWLRHHLTLVLDFFLSKVLQRFLMNF